MRHRQQYRRARHCESGCAGKLDRKNHLIRCESRAIFNASLCWVKASCRPAGAPILIQQSTIVSQAAFSASFAIGCLELQGHKAIEQLKFLTYAKIFSDSGIHFCPLLQEELPGCRQQSHAQTQLVRQNMWLTPASFCSGMQFLLTDAAHPRMVLKQGSHFLVLDEMAQVPACNTLGFGYYRNDTRALSQWEISLNGVPLSLLSSDLQRGYSGRFLYTNPQMDGIPQQKITIKRQLVLDDLLWSNSRSKTLVSKLMLLSWK